MNNNTVVTCSIGQLTQALAEALKAVSVVRPIKIGDKISIDATVTGLDKGSAQFTLDAVPNHMLRSFSFPVAVLTLAANVKEAS